MTTMHPTASNWKPTLIAGAAIFLWILFWYWETLSAMALIWLRSDTYAHGLVVPPIALWLIWRKRAQLSAMTPNSTWWPLIPLLLAVFGWLIGEMTAVNALTQFSVIAIIVLTVLALVGNAIGKRIAFPLLFLFFAVPIGDFLLPQLMERTAQFTVLALRFSGIPVYREGLQFVIPSGSWSVVEACSGIRYLIASLTVGTLFAYLTYRSLKRRLIFVGISLAVPIFANWMRAYLIVMLGHLSGNTLATGADHLIYGWAFFGLVIAIMFAIGARWSEAQEDDQPSPEFARTDSGPAKAPWSILLLLGLVSITGPLAETNLIARNNDTAVSLSAPSFNGWSATSSFTDWAPAYENPTTDLRLAITDGNAKIGLHLYYYKQQNYERKLITSTNQLVKSGDPDWRILGSEEQQTTSHRLRLAKILPHNESETKAPLKVASWYWINGHLTTSDIAAKLYMAISMLRGQGDDSAAIFVYTTVDSEAALHRFIESESDKIHDMLNTARLSSSHSVSGKH